MATAGTIALNTHVSFHPHPRREGILSMGYGRFKSSGNIDAADIGMKAVQSVMLTQYRATDGAGRIGEVVYGSVNGRGSLNNAFHFQHLKGSFKEQAAGTAHAGTRAAGTFQASWIAFGA